MINLFSDVKAIQMLPIFPPTTISSWVSVLTLVEMAATPPGIMIILVRKKK